MRTIRTVACCNLFVLASILLVTPTQSPAADIPAGPLFQLQQQINSLKSMVAVQQEQINALKARRPDFDMQEYFSAAPGIKVYQATRYIKTPSFTLVPHNQIFGTLTISQDYDAQGRLVQRWEESYDDPNPNFPLVSPPNPFTAEFLYDVTPDGLVETGYRFYNLSGVNSSTTRYDPGLLVFPFGLYAVGDMWGGAYIERFRLIPGQLQDYKQFMSRLYQYAIVGTETVTVPAGTFTDCIKIARYRGNGTDRIAWYAKGVGQVKVIFTHKDQTDMNTPEDHRFPDTLNGMYELNSME